MGGGGTKEGWEGEMRDDRRERDEIFYLFLWAFFIRKRGPNCRSAVFKEKKGEKKFGFFFIIHASSYET